MVTRLLRWVRVLLPCLLLVYSIAHRVPAQPEGVLCSLDSTGVSSSGLAILPDSADTVRALIVFVRFKNDSTNSAFPNYDACFDSSGWSMPSTGDTVPDWADSLFNSSCNYAFYEGSITDYFGLVCSPHRPDRRTAGRLRCSRLFPFADPFPSSPRTNSPTHRYT
jgi:hypothetical protein